MRTVFAASAVLLPVLAAAQAPVTLRFSPVPNKLYTYRMAVGTIANGKTNPMMDMRMTMRAGAPKASKIQMETRLLGMTMMGRPLPEAQAAQLKNFRVVSTHDARTGKVLSQKVYGAPAGTNIGSGTSVTYPTRALKIGDSWTGISEVQGRKIPAKYTLRKIGSYKGTPAVFVEAASAATPKPIGLWIERSSGLPLSMDFTMPVQGQVARTTFTRI